MVDQTALFIALQILILPSQSPTQWNKLTLQEELPVFYLYKRCSNISFTINLTPKGKV